MRYFVAAGTRHYREYPELPQAHEDVARAVELFESMGYERVLTEVSYDPDSDAFENALADWCRTPGLTADDVVVVYYAGHGDRSLRGQYRLACADSVGWLPRSWLSPSNLVEVLATSPVRNVLFIVDACHAAAVTAEIGTVTDAIVAGRSRADDFGAGTWLLASARHRDLAADGAFVTELGKAQRLGDGPSQRYLSPAVLAERINQSFVASGLAQRAACSSVDLSERPPFFVNPAFDPHAEVDGAGRVHADVSDLSSHFEPRGRGVEHVHNPGSYFTGRERALREARTHLAGTGQGHLLVVTADPGSGKSAVLGRLVLEGHADASVNAHHQTLEALVGRLAAAADVRAATAVALFTALADRALPFRVVVDSLDEAGPGGDKAEARRIAWDLLRPLAEVPCVRLVVGSRRELVPLLGDRVPVVDLDDDTYAGDTDPAEYVEKILCDAGAPYEHCPGIARRVAQEVARRAGRCFLVARMTASALLREPVVDTTVPGWAEQLPSDVGGAFENYLQRLPAGRHATTMALLTALAFGEGNGLPRRIWVRVATQLSGIALVQADVDLLLREDGSYLAHAQVNGAKYFRLYHQELTDHIKSRALQHRDLTDIQECFVETLLELVPGRQWARAPFYVRAHLATHAAGSGALDDLIEDASFVVHAEPSTLLPAVRQALRRPSMSMAVERYAYLLVDSDPAAVDRAALLAFVAHAYGERELAEGAEEISGSLERIGVEPREITPHRVVGRHEGDAYAVSWMSTDWQIEDAVLPNGSRAVLASPPEDHRVHVWLLDDPSQSTILPHPSHVEGFTLLTDRAGRVEAVTLDADGVLRIWSVADQTLVRAIPDTGYRMLFDAGFLSDGTPVVVCGDADRVTACSLRTREPLVEVECSSQREYRWDSTPGASACLAQDGAGLVHLLVCDGVRGRVTLCPLDKPGAATVVLDGLSEPVLADQIRGPRGTVVAIHEPGAKITMLDLGTMHSTVTRFPGYLGDGGFALGSGADPVFVVQNDHLLTIRLGGRTHSVALEAESLLHASLMVAVQHRGQVYTVVADFARPMQVVDCATGEAVGSPLFGHEGAVCALHVLDSSGSGCPDILAIGNDGTARLWRWGIHQEWSGPTEYPNDEAQEINTLLPWTKDPGAVLASGHGPLRRAAWDLLAPASNGVDRTLDSYGLRVNHIEETYAEDSDGTLNLLSFEYANLGTHPAVHGRRLRFHCVWHRLTTDGTARRTALRKVILHADRTLVQFLSPTRSQRRTRLVAFDSLEGRAVLLESPDSTAEWMELPLATDTAWDERIAAATAFTDLSGDTVLLAAVRPEVGAPVGRLWNLTTGAPADSGDIELAPRVGALLPHHGTAGTRWVAQLGMDGAAVIDLVANRQYSVIRGEHDRGYHREGVQWVELPTGTPVLISPMLGPAPASGPRPVLVWNATTPDTTRRLPVEARDLLWTGHAPNGEALLAVSDGDGVALCHLPSCEKVWSTPLPARVTALTAVPGSTRLDLAVGTQQGVVFLRPRLSRTWRDRLGVG